MAYTQETIQQLEARWQKEWAQKGLMAFDRKSSKEKYYVLDMFPYPSGAGLHVGHPLGYVATDIIARYKKMQGYEVLHPMGYDAFGLPAENYAIQTGQHPAITTEKNVATYRRQLDMLGLVHTPDTDIKTCDPEYYRWTQWIFLQLFGHWYDTALQKARPIAELEAHFAQKGNSGLTAATDLEDSFAASDWTAYSPQQREEVLQHYRLAYQSETFVNWCPALGTVLANEEVKDGLSERGGHPVERKPMRQWSLRITAYAQRLLEGLDTIQWPASVVEMQKNWIGRSEGASIRFAVQGSTEQIEVFTTRPDTLWGVSYLALAPEHPLVPTLTTSAQATEVEAYVKMAAARSERDRMADVKSVTGVFTGSYATHPFTGLEVPIYLADYVLVSYGTGAVMAVPAHDSRDHRFARHFDLEKPQVIRAECDVEVEAYEAKTGVMINSGPIDGLEVKDAISRVCRMVEEKGIGHAKVTYRMRDAIFSRQRYWGEPFPILYKDGIPTPVPTDQLPVTLPEVQSYKPTGTGESPLAAVESWVNTPEGRRETDTMPGWAGSSWYFMRYIDAHNPDQLATELGKWLPVDLYVGGSEHAVGHLLYSRFWTKFLYDIGHCPVQEPFRHLVNQGMIQGMSAILNSYYIGQTHVVMVSANNEMNVESRYQSHLLTVGGKIETRININLVNDSWELNIEGYLDWLIEISHNPIFPTQTHYTLIEDTPEKKVYHVFYEEPKDSFVKIEFYLNEGGVFKCHQVVEKMSKSLLNVVNPDDICRQYGADTFRLYEMFLGPLEQAKPWSTQGISGVHNFLKRTWNLFFDENDQLLLTDEAPAPAELKVLHQTLKKTAEDIERLSFNTAVPQFMILVNELLKLKCHKQAILLPYLQCLAPFAPHIAEELWARAGQQGSIFASAFPAFEEKYLVESSFEYPVSVNGKLRFKLELPLDLSPAQVEERVLSTEELQKYLPDGKHKKVVVVPGKIVNVVV